MGSAIHVFVIFVLLAVIVSLILERLLRVYRGREKAAMRRQLGELEA